MKKTLALILAVLLVAALFAGCGGGTTAQTPAPAESGESSGAAESGSSGSTQTSQPAQSSSSGSSSGSSGSSSSGSTQTSEPAESSEPAEEASPYNLPIGKYQKNADGFPTAPYEYELPLSTTDELFSLWTVCWTPQYMPESGFTSMPYPQYLEEQTGVHIEYTIVTSDQRQSNFAVLLAADDLRDISANAYSFYTGTVRESLEDGWFVNLYDYMDYMPNYMYQVSSRDLVDCWSKVFYDSDIITCFYNMYADPLPNTGFCIRKDFCDKWGVDYDAIDTFDEVYDALCVFRDNGLPAPVEIFNTLELTPGFMYSGYNTSAVINKYGLPYTRKNLDGELEFTLTTQDDKDLMAMLNKWFSEDLIDKNWASYGNTTEMTTPLTNDETGMCLLNPGEVADWESQSVNPDATWAALPRLKRSEDQTIMYGQTVSQFSFGAWSVSAKCSNIPLIVSYIDWYYSPTGSQIISYGVPGLTWDYDDVGNIRLTDFVLHNPDGIGLAWCLVLHANDGLADAGLQILVRKYAFDGGDRLKEMHYKWLVDGYKGEMDVPTSLTFTDEQEEELAEYTNDIQTFIAENYLMFVDGSAPMSAWDSYVDGVKSLGIDYCLEIYQEAYDAFMVRFS